MSPFTFNQLLNVQTDRVICVVNNRSVQWSQLRNDVFRVYHEIVVSEYTHWILACTGTYSFMTGLLALIAAGKEIYLAPNHQSGTLNESIRGAQAILSDFDTQTRYPSCDIRQYLSTQRDIVCPPINIDSQAQYIQISTSGSTGEPKQIRKALATLEREVTDLQALWGNRVEQRCFVSTVSHQHIYGLLFRVLWPLMAGHVMVDENIEYPEQLEACARGLGRLILISSPAYLKRMADVLDEQCMRQYVNVIYSSGGPLAQETAVFYTEHFATTPFEVLGSTETGGIAYRQQRADTNVVWQAFSAVELRQNPGSRALEIQSPYCFSDDWYEMGDAVEIVAPRQFRLLGRLDRIVKIEEKRISLDQMEAILQQSGLVEKARLLLLPGTRVMLGSVCILNADGIAILEKQGRRSLAERLRMYLGAYFDRVCLPRKWRYVADFPYNSQGKVTAADLLGLFEEEQHDG